ncbi:MAG: DUF2939 domain-containing protein [Parvibaculum sp.]|uniref:DUF2939 domain-containing protein n=1 Tax=Parvibaculum sp. TaxID=2024848 RepID=UPI0025E5149C|nr:DUF2939 domain-containing protein [Parvibaculum sp.]MCE9649551.1 DUF2939 domain-containing protein [Parvibaculum sp.]
MGNPVYWALGTVLVAAIAGGLAWAVATKRLGRYGPYVAGLVVFVALWTMWPYWAIYDLQTALDRGDKVRLASLVDWTSVREGVRDDLKAAYTNKIIAPDPRVQALSQAMSAAAIDRTVDQQINPSTLSEIAKAGFGAEDPMGQIRYAFFEGSPLVFRMDIGPEGSISEQQTIYLLEWNLGWKLKRIIVAPYLLNPAR